MNERKVYEALRRRAARNGAAETSGLFSSLKKAASKLSRVAAVDKLVKAAKVVSPKTVLKILPKGLRKKAEGAATKLLGAAMGGSAKAKKALRALKSVADHANPTSQAASAWRTVKRVARKMKKGDIKGLGKTVVNEAFAQAAPITSAVDAVESQISRLPPPLDASARAIVQTFPGVSAAYAITAAQQAWQRGQLFTPKGLVSLASAAPGPAGQWARAAQPYASMVGAASSPTPRLRTARYPLGYVRY